MSAPHRLLALATALISLWLTASQGRAASRFAILIGSNEGEAGEPRLHFAERDAQRMRDVLTRLGSVHAEDVLMLLTPEADELDHSLRSFRTRIADASADAHAMVIVYYSGHADERALHLSGTRYPFARLRAEVRALGAELSIFVVDACRSGGIVRAKGATPTAPFAFEVQDALDAEGTAIITSSAEGEDAQESDRLEGGVFTHHFVTGLVGAADRSNDGRVSLAEVYRYAYGQTLAATSETRIVQHPTYAFEVKGQTEIILTELDPAAGRGRLRFADPGDYLVFERSGERALVAELVAVQGTELWLRPGPYLVRRREASAVFEGAALVLADATTGLGDHSFVRVPYRHAVRKGYDLERRRALSIGGGFEVAGGVLERTAALFGGSLGLQLDFADLALQMRVRALGGGKSSFGISLSETLVGFDAGLFHLFDVGRHGVGFGVRVGADWYSQRYSDAERAPPRADQLTFRFAALARAELSIGSVMALTFDIGSEVFVVTEVQTHGPPKLESPANLTASLGLAWVLP